ncbi:MAG: heme ABC exporter ATP-binding protein CcmA [Chloroflexota bacterium]
MIAVRKLVKAFGSRVVLRGIDLDVQAGEFVTLMGANGAGKTTLLNIVATLSKKTAGQVSIGGVDLSQNAAAIRRYIGFVSHKTLLYDDLSGEQNLTFYARMYDVPDRQHRIETVLKQVGLLGRQTDPVRTYSRGMQQRLAIARAILHDPPLLLLDEPDTGLDQHATGMLSDLLKAVDADRRTVIMTSHNLERSLNLGDRVLILSKGKIALDAERASLSVADLRDQYYQLVQKP